MTDHFRILTQFKSGLEDGRDNEPRLTNEEQFDSYKPFVDGL